MAFFTKPASQVFASDDGGGNPRGASMSEVQMWAGEAETAINNLDALIPAIVDPLPEAFIKTMDVITAMGSDLPAGLHMEIYNIVKALYEIGAYEPVTGWDAAWLLATHSLQAACVNLIDPTRFALEPIGAVPFADSPAPLFMPFRGIQGDNATAYMAGPDFSELEKYQTNSACMGILITETQFEDGGTVDCGFIGNNNSYIRANHVTTAGGPIVTRANYGASEFTAANTYNDAIGLTMWSRRSARQYRVGAVRVGSPLRIVPTEGQTSDAVAPSGRFCIGRGGTTGFSWNRFGFAFIGGGWELTSARRDALWNALVGDGE